VATSSTADRYVIVPDDSQVWIEGSSSVHPIKATATGLTGWVAAVFTTKGLAATPKFTGEVRIEVGRLRSGNPLVDRETQRRIDARKFPEIVGTVTSAERSDTDTVHVTGDIAFRGEVCTVEGEISVTRDGDALILEGTQRLDVRDWGLQPPRVALLRVHPDIGVRIRLVARPST
jgi:polyisoprenoid-binding protein YceI